MNVLLEGEHDSTLKGVAVASWFGRRPAAGELHRSPEGFDRPLPSLEVCSIESTNHLLGERSLTGIVRQFQRPLPHVVRYRTALRVHRDRIAHALLLRSRLAILHRIGIVLEPEEREDSLELRARLRHEIFIGQMQQGDRSFPQERSHSGYVAFENRIERMRFAPISVEKAAGIGA